MTDKQRSRIAEDALRSVLIQATVRYPNMQAVRYIAKGALEQLDLPTDPEGWDTSDRESVIRDLDHDPAVRDLLRPLAAELYASDTWTSTSALVGQAAAYICARRQ